MEDENPTFVRIEFVYKNLSQNFKIKLQPIFNTTKSHENEGRHFMRLAILQT